MPYTAASLISSLCEMVPCVCMRKSNIIKQVWPFFYKRRSSYFITGLALEFPQGRPARIIPFIYINSIAAEAFHLVLDIAFKTINDGQYNDDAENAKRPRRSDSMLYVFYLLWVPVK